MNWLSQNLSWLVLGGAALIALISWQRYTSRRTNQDSWKLHTMQEDIAAARDPVTDNKVETAHAVTANFEGKTYFFESESSRTVFQQDPAKYVHQHHRHHGCC